jgi:protein arginine kinase activator
MKCQKCPNAATLHITEIVSEDHVEELHLCEVCAHKYLSEPQPKHGQSAGSPVDDLDSPAGSARECEMCGIKFVDFRNTHRLGCPHDYVVFHAGLAPLLQRIHRADRHVGKVPHHSVLPPERQAELVELRRRLQTAIDREAYEEAAQLRDLLRKKKGATDESG